MPSGVGQERSSHLGERINGRSGVGTAERQCERATPAAFTDHRQHAPHRLGHLFREGEAEARAVDLRAPHRSTAIERLEDVRQVLGCNPDSTIRHADLHLSLLVTRLNESRANADPSLVATVFDRVRNQVLDALRHRNPIANNRRKTCRHHALLTRHRRYGSPPAPSWNWTHNPANPCWSWSSTATRRTRHGRSSASSTSASTATVALGYRRDQVARPMQGSGFVVPRVERAPLLAATWVTSKWPGRAPEGHVLRRAFLGGGRDPHRLDRSDADLIETAQEALTDILEITGEPAFAPRLYRWTRQSPQFEVGHLERIASIEHRLASVPGLFVAGACFIVPAALIVTALAIVYVQYGRTPDARALMAGVAPR